MRNTAVLPATLHTLGLCLFMSGCTTLSDCKYECDQKLRAHQAWHAYDNCNDECFTCDYRAGWKAGYYDVATGGCGAPPVVAPRRYWHPPVMFEHDPRRRNDWYSGWQDGAACAKCEPDFHHVEVWMPCSSGGCQIRPLTHESMPPVMFDEAAPPEPMFHDESAVPAPAETGADSDTASGNPMPMAEPVVPEGKTAPALEATTLPADSSAAPAVSPDQAYEQDPEPAAQPAAAGSADAGGAQTSGNPERLSEDLATLQRLIRSAQQQRRMKELQSTSAAESGADGEHVRKLVQKAGEQQN